VAQVQAVWAKFNANERLAAIGAIVILVSWVIALVSYGLGSNIIALLGAIAVLAILYLKYAPNQSINWPAPIPTLLLAVSAVVGVVELLDLLQLVRVLGLVGGLFGGFFAGYVVALIGTIVGAAIMLWGSYQEWQGTRKTA